MEKNTYAAHVVCDSIARDARLTTIEVTLPRIVLAELNTHRVFSRNSASSRAIPIQKRIEAVMQHPFVPESMAANRPGMQAGEPLSDEEAAAARATWLRARDNAVDRCEELLHYGVHKQWANRLLEPFSWTTVVITSTEWENFFNLRISALAQPEIRRAAELMKSAMDESTPIHMQPGDWHLPYVQVDELIGWRLDTLVRLSVARCARVSYLTHDGKRDHAKDLELYARLLASRHMSPFEHAAVYVSGSMRTSNFAAPWQQHRKSIPRESVAPKEST